MTGEKSARIQSLNQSETEVLHYIFRDPNFKVIDAARELFRGEGGIRTNLTAIYDKLEVPDDIENKREWVFREYSEAYQYVFKREEWDAAHGVQRVSDTPEIFIKPPDPIVVSQPAQVTPVPAPAQPQVITRTFRVEETPTGVIVSLVLVIIVAVVLGVWIAILGITDIPVNNLRILFFDHFEDQISPELSIEGKPSRLNGYLFSYDGMAISLGDDSWVNYTIYARILQRGCEYAEGEKERQSTIGVRHGGPGAYMAYTWPACEQKKSNIIDLKITVNGDTVRTTSLNFLRAPFPLSQTGSPDYKYGGVYIILDKESYIDYILVVRLP